MLIPNSVPTLPSENALLKHNINFIHYNDMLDLYFHLFLHPINTQRGDVCHLRHTYSNPICRERKQRISLLAHCCPNSLSLPLNGNTFESDVSCQSQEYLPICLVQSSDKASIATLIKWQEGRRRVIVRSFVKCSNWVQFQWIGAASQP